MPQGPWSTLTEKNAFNADDEIAILDSEDNNVATKNKRQKISVIGKNLPEGSVDESQLVNDAVTTDKIKADAVTNAKLATDAVDTDEIKADAVTNAKLAGDAVNTAQIVADAVTTPKIPAKAITTPKLADNAVTPDQIAANAVTEEKILNSAVSHDKLDAEVKKLLITNLQFGDARAVDTNQLPLYSDFALKTLSFGKDRYLPYVPTELTLTELGFQYTGPNVLEAVKFTLYEEPYGNPPVTHVDHVVPTVIVSITLPVGQRIVDGDLPTPIILIPHNEQIFWSVEYVDGTVPVPEVENITFNTHFHYEENDHSPDTEQDFIGDSLD